MKKAYCTNCRNLKMVEYELWPETHTSKTVTIGCTGICEGKTSHRLLSDE